MSTESLIAELTLKAKPVRRIAYRRICAEWIIVSLLSLIGVGLVSGFRPDLYEQLARSIFAAEILLNMLLILVAGCAATAYAFPDRAHERWIRPSLISVFIGYSALTLYTATMISELDTSLINTIPHGLECLICILGFATAPAAFIFWRLKQLASPKPEWAGACAVMMAVATGCLGVRLVETEIVPTGLIIWHYLPLLVLSASGLWLGKKIFAW